TPPPLRPHRSPMVMRPHRATHPTLIANAAPKIAPTRQPATIETAPLATSPTPNNPANPTQPLTSPTSDLPDVLLPALETLRTQAQIPVLLPDRLPLPDEPIYASTNADADRYVIDLGYVPNCRGNACMLGTIAARRGTGDYYQLGEAFEMTIELADGTPAYFNPSVCGASCAPPVLEWEYGGRDIAGAEGTIGGGGTGNASRIGEFGDRSGRSATLTRRIDPRSR
ncbi:MAG: hypothetical protein HC795_04165, partial [Coleofasciculaceae cyanobacterium RL_1_1]|nr:hypothetical protein [Coleofasciculaceae cyanobacterium RL_1_1]